MYGWGLDTFSRPESQTPYLIPLAYFKGPDGMFFVDIVDTREGTGINPAKICAYITIYNYSDII